MKRNAFVLFGVTAGLCLTVLVADRSVHRPRPIPKPASADSLAGVIARLFPLQADSADVGRMTWAVSQESWLGLNWISTDAYAYRGVPQDETAPTVGMADLNAFRITFVHGYENNPTIIAHEMLHLMLREPGHPAATFARLESYRGR
jgi:hypothetical protein